MLEKKLNELLAGVEYISLAATDYRGRPAVTPKFLFKTENNFLYVADFAANNTFKTIKKHSRVSLPVMDEETLIAYQVNGTAAVIKEQDKDFEELLGLLKEKEVSFSVRRIIEGIRNEKTHLHFEMAFPKKFRILKIKIEEIIEILPNGKLVRERI
jgi:uncharacterized pyridoxamine 5'-phosphate oxidase family protein